MMVRSIRSEIQARLLNELQPQSLTVIDESLKHKGHLEGGRDEGTHFQVRIVSARFKHLSRMERHRLVHKLLEDLLKTHIHALSLTLLSDDETTNFS